jgi:hypothetical protein
MPDAEHGLQEPEYELAVVQQVQDGSITIAGTKAQLVVKLPGLLNDLLDYNNTATAYSS